MKPGIAGLAALLALASAGPLPAQAGPDGQLPPGCSWTRKERAARPPQPEEARRAALRDSVEAAILADLRGAPRSGPGTEAQGLAIVTTDRRRTAATVRLFRSNLADTAGSVLGARALPALQRWPGSGPVHLYLRLDSLAPAPAAPAARTYDCGPDILDRGYVSTMVGDYIRMEQRRGVLPARKLSNRVRLVVTRDGEVAHAEVTRVSGSTSFDDYVARMLSTVRFRPAVVKGVPTDAIVTLPFTLSYDNPP